MDKEVKKNEELREKKEQGTTNEFLEGVFSIYSLCFKYKITSHVPKSSENFDTKFNGDIKYGY